MASLGSSRAGGRPSELEELVVARPPGGGAGSRSWRRSWSWWYSPTGGGVGGSPPGGAGGRDGECCNSMIVHIFLDGWIKMKTAPTHDGNFAIIILLS